ncbi:hypothetical protein SK128_016441 [Halocaridina rubra]|uniref:Uncharacterized protein n=1 Tax=Halocaridina rubra TaxID=373956 RepID=A0AAN9A3D4_HALRR
MREGVGFQQGCLNLGSNWFPPLWVPTGFFLFGFQRCSNWCPKHRVSGPSPLSVLSGFFLSKFQVISTILGLNGFPALFSSEYPSLCVPVGPVVYRLLWTPASLGYNGLPWVLAGVLLFGYHRGPSVCVPTGLFWFQRTNSSLSFNGTPRLWAPREFPSFMVRTVSLLFGFQRGPTFWVPIASFSISSNGTPCLCLYTYSILFWLQQTFFSLHSYETLSFGLQLSPTSYGSNKSLSLWLPMHFLLSEVRWAPLSLSTKGQPPPRDPTGLIFLGFRGGYLSLGSDSFSPFRVPKGFQASSSLDSSGLPPI